MNKRLGLHKGQCHWKSQTPQKLSPSFTIANKYKARDEICSHEDLTILKTAALSGMIR
jgi:hypothetical protein